MGAASGLGCTEAAQRGRLHRGLDCTQAAGLHRGGGCVWTVGAARAEDGGGAAEVGLHCTAHGRRVVGGADGLGWRLLLR